MITAPDGSWRYLGPPKTGTTSIHARLAEPDVGGIHYDGQNQHGMERLDGARIFLSVRNPFARALSLWRHRRYELGRIKTGRPATPVSAGSYPFILFLLDLPDLAPFFRWPVARWIKYVGRPDELIRLESIGEDLPRLFPQITLESIPTLNTTARADAAGELCRDLQCERIVREWLKDDFQYGGYSHVCPEELR